MPSRSLNVNPVGPLHARALSLAKTLTFPTNNRAQLNHLSFQELAADIKIARKHSLRPWDVYHACQVLERYESLPRDVFLVVVTTLLGCECRVRSTEKNLDQVVQRGPAPEDKLEAQEDRDEEEEWKPCPGSWWSKDAHTSRAAIRLRRRRTVKDWVKGADEESEKLEPRQQVDGRNEVENDEKVDEPFDEQMCMATSSLQRLRAILATRPEELWKETEPLERSSRVDSGVGFLDHDGISTVIPRFDLPWNG
jgi:hypothetical protein